MPSSIRPDTKSADKLHLERFVPYRLSVLSNIVSMNIAHTYEREFGLSIPEWRVLAVLARYPSLSAIEVAERSAMDKVAVSRAVQSLLGARRLVRTYDKGDRRRSVLRLSSSGRAVYTRVAPLALSYERRLLNALDASDRRALDRLITRLLARARTLDQQYADQQGIAKVNGSTRKTHSMRGNSSRAGGAKPPFASK